MIAVARIRLRLVAYKAAAFRWWFRVLSSRLAYPLIEGRVLRELREACLSRVEFKESLCNAGLLPFEGGYVCVAKNQRFTLVNEPFDYDGRQSFSGDAVDQRKLLYVLHFDRGWELLACRLLNVIVDESRAKWTDGIEDVRLLSHRDEVWAYATGGGHTRSSWPLVGVLSGNELNLASVIAKFEPPQKNWMPFELDGVLYLEYSICPHIVLRYDPATSVAEPVAGSGREDWDLGTLELHGGAPPIRLNENLFLGVGNSQTRFWYQDRYYAPIFYLFEATPPFKLVGMTGPVRLRCRRARVQYVCGMFLDADHEFLTISYGVSDHDNYFVNVPLGSVLRLFGTSKHTRRTQ